MLTMDLQVEFPLLLAGYISHGTQVLASILYLGVRYLQHLVVFNDPHVLVRIVQQGDPVLEPEDRGRGYPHGGTVDVDGLVLDGH